MATHNSKERVFFTRMKEDGGSEYVITGFLSLSRVEVEAVARALAPGFFLVLVRSMSDQVQGRHPLPIASLHVPTGEFAWQVLDRWARARKV